MNYYLTTPATRWELADSALYISYRDVCNPNPRERNTWEAFLDLRAAESGDTARLLASYWPGKGVRVTVAFTSLDAPQHALDATRTAPAGRRNPGSTYDLVWRGSPRPRREDYERYAAYERNAVYQAAYHAWRASLPAVREHNQEPNFRPIRAAIEAVLWDVERFTRKAAAETAETSRPAN